jgi:nitroreductase
MPDALDLLARRRSTRIPDLASPAPDAQALATILTLAARVPDHGKLVPFRFIVFAGEASARAGVALEQVAATKTPDMSADQRAIERARFARSPMVIAVVSRAAPHPKIPVWEQELAGGVAAAHLCLAAQGLGYGTNWITEWYAYDEAAKSALGIAPQEKVVGFIHIGTALARAEDRPRPALADIVTYA